MCVFGARKKPCGGPFKKLDNQMQHLRETYRNICKMQAGEGRTALTLTLLPAWVYFLVARCKEPWLAQQSPSASRSLILSVLSMVVSETVTQGICHVWLKQEGPFFFAHASIHTPNISGRRLHSCRHQLYSLIATVSKLH